MEVQRRYRTRPPSRNPVRKATITWVLATGFFLVAANIAFIPPLLEFIRTDLNMSGGETTALLAAFPFITFVGNIVLGPYIDRLGRKPFLLAGSAGCAAIFLSSALTTDASILILLRGLTGITMPMIGASIFPSIADHFQVDERVKVTGYVMAAFSVAQLATMPLGVLVGGYLSWRTAFLALAAFSLLIFVSALLFLPGRDGRTDGGSAVTLATYKTSWLSFTATPAIRTSFLSYVAVAVGLFVVLGLYPTWVLDSIDGAGRAVSGVAVLFFVGELAGLTGSLVAGGFASFFDKNKMLFVAVVLGLTACSVLAMPLFEHRFMAQVGVFALFSTGRALALTVFLAVVYQMVGEARRSTLNGGMNALYQLAAGVGVSLSSLLYGASASFWLNAGAGASAFAVAAGVLAMSFRHEPELPNAKERGGKTGGELARSASERYSEGGEDYGARPVRGSDRVGLWGDAARDGPGAPGDVHRGQNAMVPKERIH